MRSTKLLVPVFGSMMLFNRRGPVNQVPVPPSGGGGGTGGYTGPVDVTINANDAANCATSFNAVAAGKVIKFTAGLYHPNAEMIPKNGQTVVSQGQVTIDGQNSTAVRRAFFTSSVVSNVIFDVIDRANDWMTITRFPTYSNGYDTSGGNHPMAGAFEVPNVQNWTINRLECSFNGTPGLGGAGWNLFQANGVNFRNCRAHHNVTGGYAHSACTNLNLTSCEFDHNFTDTSLASQDGSGHASSYVNDGGGGKTSSNTGNGIVFDACNFHDNTGFGCWFDGNNIINIEVKNSMFSNNFYGGLMIELAVGTGGNMAGSGYSALVHNNTFINNGNQDWNQLFGGAAIRVSAAGGVDIYGNIIDGSSGSPGNGGHGIVFQNSPRGNIGVQKCRVGIANTGDSSRINHIRCNSGANQSSQVKRVVSIYVDNGSQPIPTGMLIDGNDYYMDNIGSDLHFAEQTASGAYNLVNYAAWQTAGALPAFDLGSTTHAFAAWPF